MAQVDESQLTEDIICTDKYWEAIEHFLHPGVSYRSREREEHLEVLMEMADKRKRLMEAS